MNMNRDSLSDRRTLQAAVRLQNRVLELAREVDELRAGQRTALAENARLLKALETARDVLTVPCDDEDNDSPGNMAWAILNHALNGGETT
jgi:regulator of replication initiation timing